LKGEIPDMDNNEKQAALVEVLRLINEGNKLQAIKLFHETFPCSLKQAKEAVEAMEFGGSSRRNYDGQKFDTSFTSNQQKSSKGRSTRLSFPWILLIVALLSPLLILAYTLTMPTLKFQAVAVELESGEIYEWRASTIGAVTRKGEYFVEYEAKTLAIYAALYTAPYFDTRESRQMDPSQEGWNITNSANPWFEGMIDSSSSLLKAYYTTERIYDSPTSFHREDALYDQSGAAIWSHDDRERLSGSYIKRATIGFSRSGSGKAIDFFFPNCVNIHQFLAEKYGIDVEMVYDKKNKMVIFRIPKSAIVLE